jgi:hypothetical protein
MTVQEMQNKEDQQTTRVLIRVGPTGQLPLYATPGSAGCDLIAARDLVLLPGETSLMPLDLVMALEPGVEAQVRPRSGLSLRTSLRLPNTREPSTAITGHRSASWLRTLIPRLICPCKYCAIRTWPGTDPAGPAGIFGGIFKTQGKAAYLEQLPDRRPGSSTSMNRAIRMERCISRRATDRTDGF